MVAGWLAATWVGLLSLEKVVTSARLREFEESTI